MFGLGPWELAIVAGAVLMLAGPALLPRLGRYLGRTLTELKDSAESFSDNLRSEMNGDVETPRLTDGTSKEPVEETGDVRKAS